MNLKDVNVINEIGDEQERCNAIEQIKVEAS
jgi:hypothetical protein